MKLTIITLDDWAGVYDERGNLMNQGHSIDWREVLLKMDHELDSHYIEGDDLDEFGNTLPNRLKDILDYIAKK